MDITILLADDHKLMRQGLHALVEEQPGMTVVGQAEDGRSAVELARQLSPQVVVMDVSMPGMGGIEATRSIKAANEATKILGLSMYMDKRYVLGMLHAGASGYLLKDCAIDELVEAISNVAANRTYLSPQISHVLFNDILQHIPVQDMTSCSALTEREREVLRLLAEGGNTKEIASRLDVSVKTIEFDRRQIMDKLDLSNMAELMKFVIREGITSLDADGDFPKSS